MVSSLGAAARAYGGTSAAGWGKTGPMGLGRAAAAAAAKVEEEAVGGGAWGGRRWLASRGGASGKASKGGRAPKGKAPRGKVPVNPPYKGRLPPQPKAEGYKGPKPNAVADGFYKATVVSLIGLTLVYLWNFGSMGTQIILQSYGSKQEDGKKDV